MKGEFLSTSVKETLPFRLFEILPAMQWPVRKTLWNEPARTPASSSSSMAHVLRMQDNSENQSKEDERPGGASRAIIRDVVVKGIRLRWTCVSQYS